MKRNKLEKKWTPLNIAVTLILLVFAFIIIYPIVWGLINSFKHILDWNTNKLGFPTDTFIPKGEPAWQFVNYEIALMRMFIQVDTRKVYTWEMALNSVIYAGVMTFVTVFMHSLIAYIVSKYKFRFGKVVYGIVLVTMMLPIVGSMASGLQVRRDLGIYGKFIGEVAIAAGGFGGMHFLIFYACFKSISWSYAEAAQMDGAGHFMIFLRIMLPLAWSTVSAVALLNFIGYWNNYETPLVYLPNMPTLAVGLFRFKSTFSNYSSEPRTLAATMIIAIPTLALFIAFRNKIMGNIAVGGLKG